MIDPRVEAMYQAGVGARRPTPAQLAQMARMMRDLESIPDSNYNDLEAAATEIAPDPELVRPYYGRRPGTRARMDGTPAMPGAEFASPEEAAEYTIMGTDPETGERTPSPHAQYMQDELNLAQVATVDGPAFMASGADLQPMNPDGTVNPHYLRRQQMLAPNPRLGGAPSWEPDSSMMTPGGKNVEVMVPTQANRDRMADFDWNRRLAADMRRTGKTREELIAQYGLGDDAEGRKFLERQNDPMSRRRNALAEQRALDLGARQRRMRDERAFAGGSQNITPDNAAAIRQLVGLQNNDPAAYNKMLAEFNRPRNVQQRWNPRTGQFEFSSEIAFPPPEPAQDARTLMAMIQRETLARMEENNRREQRMNVRARALVLANPSMGGLARGLSRQEARQRLIREKLADVTIIDEVLDEIYGPSDEPAAPPAAAAPGTLDPTATLPAMPGPEGAGTGMPYQYRY